MFLSCSHGATGDVEEKHNLKGLFLLFVDTEDEGGGVRNLYEFARNSGRENGKLEREKNREGSTRNY